MSDTSLPIATAASAASSAASGPTPQALEALHKLADVATPPPVPWIPQTVGWAVLAVVLVLLGAWWAWRAAVNWRRNRYRREALAELALLEAHLDDAAAREQALRAVAPLLKRCALVAWPRVRTASLNGDAWTEFLDAHARGTLAPGLRKLLTEGQYLGSGALQSVAANDARAVLAGARQWVRQHSARKGETHVPA